MEFALSKLTSGKLKQLEVRSDSGRSLLSAAVAGEARAAAAAAAVRKRSLSGAAAGLAMLRPRTMMMVFFLLWLCFLCTRRAGFVAAVGDVMCTTCVSRQAGGRIKATDDKTRHIAKGFGGVRRTAGGKRNAEGVYTFYIEVYIKYNMWVSLAKELCEHES